MSVATESRVYVDTSVLANRYLPSAISEAVDAFFDRPDHAFSISELTLLELESALSRQQREKRLSARRVGELRARVEDDLRLGFFSLEQMSSSTLKGARLLIAEGRVPLNTLDSIHLRTALDMNADAFATDDRQLARAAARHGLATVTFD